MSERHTVRIPDRDIELSAEEGQTVLSALLDGGVEWMHVCGMKCNCSTCAVRVVEGGENLSEMEEDERTTLKRFRGPEALEEPVRLSCQATVHGDVSLAAPEW